MDDDFTGTLERIARGELTSRQAVERAIEAATAPDVAAAFVATSFDVARAAADAADQARAVGRDPGVLGGLPVSIKDLFDVEGEPTRAGAKSLADAPPAAHDAPAVARLRAAGAAFVGRTHMSEFAFSGVGWNPHATPLANAATRGLDAEPRIPGGSTSGGAVSVAAGAACVALGSDTGGSIRIPAALHGLVGFKNTQRLVPRDGAYPLSTTLDTVCAITRSVRDAIAAHETIAARRVEVQRRPLASWRFAVPRTLMLDDLEPGVASAFERALRDLATAGAHVDEIDLPELAELASLNAGGGFAPAEAWRHHRERLASHEASYDRRVAMRIRRGEATSDADLARLVQARADWIARMEAALAGHDAMLSPTVPMLAPTLASIVDDDERFFAVNGRLLRNPSAVNFLDGCAISIPCGWAGGWPVGLMLWHGALHDDAILSAALTVEAALSR